MKEKLRHLAGRLDRTLRLALNSLWAIPAVLLVRVIRPWILVRFGIIDSSRIGHFMADTSIFLARHCLQPATERTIDLYWFPSPSCNEQWARMVRRQLLVRWWVRYLIRINRLIPGGAAHTPPRAISVGHRDVYQVLRESSTRFEFTADEDETAESWLKRRGWREGEAFVCLAVRDSAYLALDALHSSQSHNRWEYHNYRDSDVDRYVDSVRALLDRGYWVIRMGKFAHKRLPIDHHRVIDYPFVADQDDLMDVWLGAHCHFFISSGTGIDTTATIYGKRVVFVNSLPLRLIFSSVNQIWVPKHLRWRDSGLPLSLRDHCQHGYTLTAQYDSAGILIDELSPSEIADAVSECEKRVDGSWVETEEEQARQRRFWNVMREWPDFVKVHGNIHPEARVGAAWLKSMGEDFLA